MSLINKIKNLFRKNEEIQEIKQIPVDTKFQSNRFKNIKIYAPDSEMKHGAWKDFEVRIFDGASNPIANSGVIFEINGKKYDYMTDDEGYASIPITLKAKKYEMETYFPADEQYAPRVVSKLTVLRQNQDFTPEKDINTRLYTPDMIIYSKDEPDYCVRLMDSDENPISDEKITITINDESYERITDKEGFASVDVSLKQDIYNVETVFEGSDKYDAISQNSKIEVKTRNIDRDVMIEVEHLAMEFKVSKDKIDTLKEYVIRTIKRNKNEGRKVRILDDVSFKIYEGERVGILGFNGAGKSTLLRIISGIYEPTEGTIKINGKIAPLLELSAGFDKNYTGKNNIFLNGALLSMDEEFIKEKYDEIVEFSELGEHINYPVKNYSKGMRAKLGFSIATLINPEILIIDEILAVGDIKFRKKSSEKIRSMMKEGVTVLLVSHSINQIKNICDRCIWLEDGKVYMEGETKKVCDAYIKRSKRK